MNKWTYTTLGKISEIITGPFGSQLHQSDYVEQGIPVVMPQDIDNRRVNYASINYVSNEDAIRLERYKTIINDILYARRGDVEKHAFIKEKDNGVLCGTGCLRVRITTSEVEPEFISFFLNREETRKWLVTHAVGTNMPNLNTDILSGIPIAYPLLEEQRKIVQVLNSLDEKIALNSALNDNLEQQIKTIFTFQFLQNANTEWKQQSLAELSEMYQPKTISGKDLIADGNYFVYGANGIIGKYNQYNHSESEIAVACRGASCGSIQMTLPFSWITGNAMVVKPHSDFPYREYLYYYLLAKNPNYLCSGSAQPQLTRENLTLYSLKVPSTTELNAFESYAEKVRKIIIKNQQENIELSTLRDWLLPMLMNGQATISD